MTSLGKIHSKQMATLNCESFESTLASIANIYAIDESIITPILKGIQFDPIKCTGAWNQYVFDEFEKIIGHTGKGSKTIWFHLTRCKAGTTFDDGILPLNLALPRIQAEINEMITLATKKNLFLQSPSSVDNNSGYLYGLKTSNENHWGPYAMLVKEISSEPHKAMNHDYLAIPEIVEDIINRESRTVDVQRVYRESTRPCIVKFVENNLQERCLIPAVFYLHTKLNGEELGIECNTCFDARGVVIPRDQILSVEFLN